MKKVNSRVIVNAILFIIYVGIVAEAGVVEGVFYVAVASIVGLFILYFALFATELWFELIGAVFKKKGLSGLADNEQPLTESQRKDPKDIFIEADEKDA